MKKVLIINEGFSNNLGDQAINKSITDFFKSKGYITSFLYLSNPELTKLPNYTYLSNATFKVKKRTLLDKVKTYFFFFYWLFKFKRTIINTLKKGNFDTIAIGGGQLIISSGTFALSGFSITLFWFSYLIKRYSKAKLYLVAVGASTSFNVFESYLFSKSLKRIDNIWVRDHFSKNILQEKFKINANLIPDIAFYSDKKERNQRVKEEVALIGITNYKEVYQRYNKTESYSKFDYFSELHKVVQKYEEKKCQVKLFYTTIPDAQECLFFKDFLAFKFNKKIEICKTENLTDLVKQLDKTKYVYSGRMHALILGLKSKCEITPYIISQKLQSFDEKYAKGSISINEIQKEINQQLINIV